MPHAKRRRQLLLLAIATFFVLCVVSFTRLSPADLADQVRYRPGSFHSGGGGGSSSSGSSSEPADDVDSPAGSPTGGKVEKEERPKNKPAPKGSHPIWHLMTEAERDLQATLGKQSKTVDEAVKEYRRRYRIAPPPNFDKWFDFARERNVQLVDEFDMVLDMLTPFWALKPLTIRKRAKEALGFDNAMLGVSIRNGNITKIDGGPDWQREATRAMLEPFVKWLPPMDLCFNIHDESRVMVPHDDMSRLVHKAKTVDMPAAAAVRDPVNEWTTSPVGLNEGKHWEAFATTRFNEFAHQNTWTHSRMSCPPDSPARSLEDGEASDASELYGMGELGFVYNVTALSDVCLSPSLATTYGFFERPNAYDIVHDLFPVFSPSKISSYADILYPSPWYWADKAKYEQDKDVEWAEKEDNLYWRGSTTGGFSRAGGWKRQHRQRFVDKVNADDDALILANRGGDKTPLWEPKTVRRQTYAAVMDVLFSHVGQCDPSDCEAQRKHFDVQERVDFQDAWRHKYLLDMDGNAFSGRFHAFLRSRSLVYKFAVFREWHAEWLRPWAHYIPLSLRGDDWLEAVRFFGDGPVGKKEAERVALQSREWAGRVLRKEDLEVWFFRLLLE